MVDNFLANVFVIEGIVDVIREAQVVSWVMNLCVYNNVLLLGFLFFVEAYEGSQSEICDSNDRVVVHNSFHSVQSDIRYVLVLRKDQIKL